MRSKNVDAENAPKKPIPHGVIHDYPVMKERALHVDIGRKYFTCQWIKERIREMSLLRLNTLQLHFSEMKVLLLPAKRGCCARLE